MTVHSKAPLGQFRAIAACCRTVLLLLAGFQSGRMAMARQESFRLDSCAATGCHGKASTSEFSWMSSYTKWVEQDPHANAYLDLFNPLSRQIVRRLAGETHGPGYEQQLRQRCIVCHASAQEASRLIEGVSCASCHGDQPAWTTEHYGSDWRRLSIQEQANRGLLNLDDLAVRARVCLDCHVGAVPASQAVSHDLIAAGHPRLAFEFSSFFAVLQTTAHWDVEDDHKFSQRQRAALTTRSLRADFHLESWADGQQAAAGRYLRQIADQLSTAAAPRALDFASSDCWACHRDLSVTATSVRSDRSESMRPLLDRWYSLELSGAFVLDAQQRSARAPVWRRLNATVPTTEPDRFSMTLDALQQHVAQTAERAGLGGSPSRRQLAERLSSDEFHFARLAQDERVQWCHAAMACIRSKRAAEGRAAVDQAIVRQLAELHEMLLLSANPTARESTSNRIVEAGEAIRLRLLKTVADE